MTQGSEEPPNADQVVEEPGLEPAEALTPGNPYNLSKGMLLLFRITAAILVVSMTALVFTGIFHL